MSQLNKSLFFVFCILIIQSCTIEKRLYNRGSHVEWKKHFKNSTSSQTIKLLPVENENSEIYFVEHSEKETVEELIFQKEKDTLPPQLELANERTKYDESGREHIPKLFSEKQEIKPIKRSTFSGRSDVLGVVLVFLLIFVLLPVVILLFLVASEYLELILLGLIIALVVGIVVFFIVRMIVTAVRY